MARIEKYSFGSITIDGRTYKADLIIYPDKVQENWWRKSGHTLHVDDIREILDEPPDVLIVGQGDSARMELDSRVKDVLNRLQVELFAAATGPACTKFNELSESGKKVVAALHLTC